MSDHSSTLISSADFNRTQQDSLSTFSSDSASDSDSSFYPPVRARSGKKIPKGKPQKVEVLLVERPRTQRATADVGLAIRTKASSLLEVSRMTIKLSPLVLIPGISESLPFPCDSARAEEISMSTPAFFPPSPIAAHMSPLARLAARLMAVDDQSEVEFELALELAECQLELADCPLCLAATLQAAIHEAAMNHAAAAAAEAEAAHGGAFQLRNRRKLRPLVRTNSSVNHNSDDAPKPRKNHHVLRRVSSLGIVPFSERSSPPARHELLAPLTGKQEAGLHRLLPCFDEPTGRRGPAALARFNFYRSCDELATPPFFRERE